MTDALWVAKAAEFLGVQPAMANRHGLIAGATGTGKTVTLQTLAEAFSRIGTPVFMADVKGDLTGITQPGGQSPKVLERVQSLGIPDFAPEAMPGVLWDVFGTKGHPIRTTVSEMGPLLFSRLLGLNETQSGVLSLVFKIADDNGLLLLDLKDFRAVLQHVGENARSFTTEYGNISAASIGAIQRNLLALEQEGAAEFFGEPALNIDDLLQTDSGGRGVINILAADSLLQSPKVYSTLLLWLLSELFERLPEAGDLEKPKLVFFFDEAHLLFDGASPALEQKIEQVVRLIRSKGVGVYFVTQNPSDVPDAVLGQLGNRVQHALRAFTPADEKGLRAAARSFRTNPAFDTARAIQELGVGEALISFLDAKGQPCVVERAFVLPPRSRIGPITDAERAVLIQKSGLHAVYGATVDRVSAYETLREAVSRANAATAPARKTDENSPLGDTLAEALGMPASGGTRPKATSSGGRQSDSVFEAMAKSAARSIGSSVGRQLVRGLLGSLLGGSRRRR